MVVVVVEDPMHALAHAGAIGIRLATSTSGWAEQRVLGRIQRAERSVSLPRGRPTPGPPRAIGVLDPFLQLVGDLRQGVRAQQVPSAGGGPACPAISGSSATRAAVAATSMSARAAVVDRAEHAVFASNSSVTRRARWRSRTPRAGPP